MTGPAPRRRKPRVIGADGELVEAAFQRNVLRALRAWDWRLIYHAPDGGSGGGRSGKPKAAARGQIPEGTGFPDVVALRGPRLLVAELKRHDGRYGPGQREWLEGWETFARAVLDGTLADGAPWTNPAVYVRTWRPADWLDVLDVARGGDHRRFPELEALAPGSGNGDW